MLHTTINDRHSNSPDLLDRMDSCKPIQYVTCSSEEVNNSAEEGTPVMNVTSENKQTATEGAEGENFNDDLIYIQVSSAGPHFRKPQNPNGNVTPFSSETLPKKSWISIFQSQEPSQTPCQ